MKTAELTGAELDRWVAKVGGQAVVLEAGQCWLLDGGGPYYPSTSWALGGPIIERERIAVSYGGPGLHSPACWWARPETKAGDIPRDSFGPTPLIAAMRAFVASKFGPEVSE